MKTVTDETSTDPTESEDVAETKVGAERSTKASVTSAVEDSSDVADRGDVEDSERSTQTRRRRDSGESSRRISVSVKSAAVGAAILALIAALGVMTWLYIGAKHGFADQTSQVDDNRHAEQVALDYAVNAAIMDYKNLGPWKQNIVNGTTPELGDKLTKAATAMEQIVLPLQWGSTAKPLAAKVRSTDKGVYVVDAFVSVMTKTVQTQEELQSTATYAVTIDSNNAWKITDVGGIASVVGK